MAIVTSSRNRVRATVGWRQAIKAAIRDPLELCRQLDLPACTERTAVRAASVFPTFVPWEFLARMEPGNPRDPLLRQVLPLDIETEATPGFGADAVGDRLAVVRPGLLHKYQGRALLVTTGVCAVHCRYCFRRHYPYDEIPHSVEQWRDAIAAVAADQSIEEIILSGGDPLMLADDVLRSLVEQFARIGHLRRLRVHTRLPIMIPQRLTQHLLDTFAGSGLTTFFVVHANHPRELDGEVAAALARIADRGLPLLNQSVLLSGVNDDAGTLVALSKRLIDLRVTPYYLHQLDRVSGTAHFEVPIARGMRLIQQMREQLPGYAVPRYVREVAGDPSKRVLA